MMLPENELKQIGIHEYGMTIYDVLCYAKNTWATACEEKFS